MALTDQQKQEVLDIIKDNTSLSSYNVIFEGDVLVSKYGYDYCYLYFNKPCTVPYITDMSNIFVTIEEGASVDFPNTIIMRRLTLEPGASISAPELTELGEDHAGYSLRLDDHKNLYLPKLKNVDTVLIDDGFIEDLNIESCAYLTVHSGVQFITKTLKLITGYLSLHNNSTIIFLNDLDQINIIYNIRAQNTTIIAPESSSDVFNKTIFPSTKPEIILVSEED